MVTSVTAEGHEHEKKGKWVVNGSPEIPGTWAAAVDSWCSWCHMLAAGTETVLESANE